MPYNNGPIGVLQKQKNYTIYFTHVPTDTAVSFPAWLTDFKDNYSSQWTTENVFGRYDPIYTFAQTTRNISFSFDVLAVDEKEAEKNLSDLRLLTRMLYPTYSNDGYATTILKAPLMRIRFANLIARGANGTGEALLGKINGFNISPVNDMSYFDPGTKLFAKVFSAMIQFDVLHEESPGGWPTSRTKAIVGGRQADTKTATVELQRSLAGSYVGESYEINNSLDLINVAGAGGMDYLDAYEVATSDPTVPQQEKDALFYEVMGESSGLVESDTTNIYAQSDNTGYDYDNNAPKEPNPLGIRRGSM